MKFEFKDKVVLITGGADGIGKDLVMGAAKKGSKVVFCDIFNAKGIELASKLTAEGYDVCYLNCDVSNASAVSKMFLHIKEKFGKLDVLINNAAKQATSSWHDMSEDEFSSVIDVNLKGVFYCMKHASSLMTSGSNITNILSIYYNKPRINKFHYDAAKSGVAQLTREAALALGEQGISVNGIYPGYVTTPMNLGEDASKALTKNVLKDPEIIKSVTFANAVLTYIEHFALLTTGQLFGVDAGRSLN